MNWLAHLHLSEPTPEFRLGSILPDFVSIRALADLPLEYQRGIQRHRQIDACTDAHPIFRRSVQRFEPPFRRFGGVLVDIFYDHFLARDWDTFSAWPLPVFAAEFYASFEAHWSDLPPEARPRLQAMREADLLCSYREISGIREVLERIGSRLRRPTDLAASITILERDYDSFRGDFHEFFPQLVRQIDPFPAIDSGRHRPDRLTPS